jgi:hypothetical protein
MAGGTVIGPHQSLFEQFLTNQCKPLAPRTHTGSGEDQWHYKAFPNAPPVAGDAVPCNVNNPVVNRSDKFNDRFSVYENSEVGIAQPTLVQVILAA